MANTDFTSEDTPAGTIAAILQKHYSGHAAAVARRQRDNHMGDMRALWSAVLADLEGGGTASPAKQTAV